MAYAAWSVIAGEQPTTSKWNILGTNDASFNDGSGLAFTTNNVVPANALKTNTIALGYAQITANASTTSLTPVAAGLSAAVTIPAGGRKVRITVWSGAVTNNTNSDGTTISIWDGTVGSGTLLASCNVYQPAANQMQVPVSVIAVVTPSAGAKTYNVGIQAVTGGTSSMIATATSPAFILVEAI
jgi:hypothetical protein